jgi:serine protease Do
LVAASDRSHAKVLAAFRDVVATPAKSTVQIYCDKHSAALGTIVDPSGYIVTKASELDGKIECQLNAPGQRFEATVVARDHALDLAVLKIDAKDLPAIAWSDGDAPAVGSWLVTPGLSQVPLAIGVLSVSPRRIVAPPGALGIDLDDPDQPARIKAVRPNSAAKTAGLEAGDIILKVNGKAVANNQELVMTVRGYQPGESIELVIKRGDQELTKTAVLGSLAKLFHPEGEDRAEFQNHLGGQLSERRYGFPSVIQHDSVLKPSECGGPIVDLDGKAVGINIARAGRVESFALPGSVVREAVKKMLETHQTSTPVER